MKKVIGGQAVMEGVMYSQRQNLDVLRGMKVAPDAMLACGGGGTSPFWRQMLADVFDCPVATTVSTEGPALGAAILAGVLTSIPMHSAKKKREADVYRVPGSLNIRRRSDMFLHRSVTRTPRETESSSSGSDSHNYSSGSHSGSSGKF